MDKISHKKNLAFQFLKQVGNKHPSDQQIEMTERLLFSTISRQQLHLEDRLSPQEANCLLLAAKGFSVDETAELLTIQKSTVATYRKNILKKLSCKTITQALFEAVCFGALEPRAKTIPLSRGDDFNSL